MKSLSSYEWASVVQPLLETYLNVSKEDGTTQALNEKLDDGVALLNANQEKLKESLQSFVPLTSRIRNLKSQFDTGFDKSQNVLSHKITDFFAVHKDQPVDAQNEDLGLQMLVKLFDFKQFGEDLELTIQGVTRNIEETKAKLQEEIGKIENLKSKIDPLKTALNSDSASNDDVTTSAQNLIAECKKYRERHVNKMAIILYFQP